MGESVKKVSVGTNKSIKRNSTNQNENVEGRYLDIVVRLITELKAQNNSASLVRVTEKLFEIYNCQRDTSVLRMKVLLIFLDMLKDCKFEDYNGLFYNVDVLFMSKELKTVSIEETSITQNMKLGQGDFGTVHLGELKTSNDSTRNVAIKTTSDSYGDKILLGEAKIMANLDHKNVVKLVAFRKEPLQLIMEHMELGNLREAVKNCNYTNMELLKSLQDIASGMEYITRKKYIHRDLYCKNVLVDSKKTCKLGDFGWARYTGFSKDGSFKEKGTPIIVYQTPLESIVDQVFSTKTDVWSFGILVLELFHWAECLNDDILARLISLIMFASSIGIILLQCPVLCPVPLFDYVKGQIFKKDPQSRPSFTAIRTTLDGIKPFAEPNDTCPVT